MSAKKTVFAGNANSQYDPGLIAKEVHDFFGQSIRTVDTRSVISGYFTHFRADYNSDSDPTKVSYFRGTKPYITKITFTVPTSGSYFVLHSAPENQRYLVWYNVDGTGTAPVTSAKLIQINISSSDTPEIVALVTQITLSNLYAQLFTFTAKNGTTLEIRTTGLGVVDPSLDVNTGFTITGTDGEQDLVDEITISYIGADPIYNGQVLKGYNYDIYSGKFVKNPKLDVQVGNVGIADTDGDQLQVNPDGSLNVNVVSTAQVLKSYFTEINNIAPGVTSVLCSYTPTADVYLQKIEFSGTNIASFELVIDGITQDKKLTFFNGNLENRFDFNAGLNISAGKEIKVYVVHTRTDPGSFNARMQILESGT